MGKFNNRAKKIFIVCGQYGSGKTEFCVNLALTLRRETGVKVSIADYDVINPYFRSREKAKFLLEYGIDILGNSTGNLTGTDLPALSANIASPILNNEYLIIDLAGSRNGLKPLAAMRDSLGNDFDFLCVLNAFRPETKSETLMINTVRSLEGYSGIKMNGIIHNSHLVHETTAADVLYGQDMVKAASGKLRVPVMFTQIKRDIYDEISDKIIGRPIIFEKLAMRENWQD